MTHYSGLRFGALSAHTLHVVIDMQRLFAEAGVWHTPALNDITPAVADIVAHRPEQTVFTRFITATTPDQANGTWQRYYQHWQSVTLTQMDAARLDLVEGLSQFTPPAEIIDKTTHSAFESADFLQCLKSRQADTLIFTGVETDVCVLASVMTAVDRGYRTIVVADAVASSSLEAHQATLEKIFPRFDQQIETVLTQDLLKNW